MIQWRIETTRFTLLKHIPLVLKALLRDLWFKIRKHPKTKRQGEVQQITEFIKCRSEFSYKDAEPTGEA